MPEPTNLFGEDFWWSYTIGAVQIDNLKAMVVSQQLPEAD